MSSKNGAQSYVIVTNIAKSSHIDLQAMFNDAPHATNRRYAGGVTIELGPGVFYTGGAMWTNKYGVDSITLKGQGGVQTCLVFTNNSGLDFSGSGSFNGIGVNLQGLLIASTVDSNYFLVRIANNSRSIIDDVTFHFWPSATNNGNSGIQVPLGLRTPSANGLCGLYYDGLDNFGDAFVVQDCNFDSLVVGAVIAGNHARLYNNFFEGINRGGGVVGQAKNTWPASDALHLGGALYLGRAIDRTAIQSFAAVGNHWFNCSNAIVDLRSSDDGPLNEVRFIDSQFELGQSILMLVDSAHRLFFDGVSYSPPLVRNFTTGLVPMDGNTGGNPNFRVRASDHFSGSWQFDSLSSPDISGNGSGLTNLTEAVVTARNLAGTNESATARYLITTNTAVHHRIDLQAMLDSLPHATNRMYPGGGTIELGEGIYYTSGALYTNYSGVDSITIRGKGIVQTCLVFTNNAGLTLRGNGNNIGLHLQGVVVASTVDSNYFLVHLQNNNRTIIEDCAFGYWPFMTNGIGLELGVVIGAHSVSGLGGVWYDGVPNPLGDAFILARNNFNTLAIGAYLNANHPRLEDNFFEVVNCDGDPEQPAKTSAWPATSPLSLGGAVILGPHISSFSGRGNHWFRCVNPIVDLRRNAINEVIFHDNEFELSGGGILMITNGTSTLTIDGITWGEPALLLYEINTLSGYSLSATSYDSLPNPNYRSRIGGHYRGNYDFPQRPSILSR